MRHPVDAYLRYVSPTARIFGGNLSPQDREEMEAHMRVELWRAWLTFDPTRGKRTSYLIHRLRCAAREWMRVHRPGRLTRGAIVTIRRAPPGSLEWDAIPWRRRQDILQQLAVRRPACLDDLVAVEDEDGIRGEPTDPAPLPEERIIQRERIAEVLRLVGMLPPREKRVLRLLYLEGLTFEEVGRRMGVSAATIANSRNRAIEKLRIALDARVSRLAHHARILARLEAAGVDRDGSLTRAQAMECAEQEHVTESTVRRVFYLERAARRMRL